MEPKEAIRQSAVWHPGHGGPPGTPHEYLGCLKGPKIPQNTPKLTKSEKFELIFKKHGYNWFKAPIMAPLGMWESQG